MKPETTLAKLEVTADGEGLVSHAGAALLSELAGRTGLSQALCAELAPTREPASAHDPGLCLADLAVSIADGGDCVTDLGALRGQPDLFGEVASDSTDLLDWVAVRVNAPSAPKCHVDGVTSQSKSSCPQQFNAGTAWLASIRQ